VAGPVIVFPHGGTNPDQADTDPFNLANVDKQRQIVRVQADEWAKLAQTN
jgi:hypothetical protein